MFQFSIKTVLLIAVTASMAFLTTESVRADPLQDRIDQAIKNANIQERVNRAVDDAIKDADIQGRVNKNIAEAMAKISLPASVAVAPFVPVAATCSCGGCPGNPAVTTAAATPLAASTSRYWRVWPDGSRTACDVNGNALGATTGACTLNPDGTYTCPAGTSCGQAAYQSVQYADPGFAQYMNGTSGGCANGQCGSASAGRGFFRRGR